MLKKTITYTDFNNVEKTEDFYFNLTKSEAAMMEMGTEGGYVQHINRIVADNNGAQIMKVFQDFILRAYGQKTNDGKFMKSEDISREFTWTAAYDELFMSLVTDPKAAAAFVEAVLPTVEEKKE